MQILEQLMTLTNTPLGIFELISLVIIGICILVIVTSVLVNFAEGKRNVKVKNKKKSIVETGTMALFFIIFYLILRSGIGNLQLDALIRIPLIILSLIILIFGCYVNVKGRLMLGKNWANQIKIYGDHTLVTKGVYSIVRHPLYASLIWMFYAASFIYLNYLAFLANTLIFIPFMYYRAKQEEKLLEKEFKEYGTYRKKVGMFFPKIIR